MILRVIRGQADEARLRALQAALEPTLAPAAAPAGRARLHVASRRNGDDLDVLLLAFWDSPEAAAAADRQGTSALTIAGRVLPGSEAVHFEIDETLRLQEDAGPIAIRMATGHFSRPGADLHMQQLLRERVPLIGDEMSEAYIGRRLDGRSVDVTFVSAWQRLPADRRLEDTFWPDITINYDRFAVDVYRPLGVSERID